ncbi:MAG: sulfatase [Planctomycetota bacterium]
MWLSATQPKRDSKIPIELHWFRPFLFSPVRVWRQLVFVVAALILLLGKTDSARADSPPNVLFIAVDDLGCTLGCYDDPIARTPHIDRLATEGVCFLRAYNQIPLCNPSRASVMTGMRPDTLKVYDLDRHFRDELPNVVTLPQAFQQAGYTVARIGKIYHYNVPASIGSDGFDDAPSWQQTINPIGRDKTDEALVFNAEPHRKISGALSWLAADGDALEQTDGMIATAAIDWMTQNRGEPFFLGVGFFRPHTPYVAPRKYFDMYPVSRLRLPYAPKDDRSDIPVAAFAHNCPVPHYGLATSTLLEATQAYYACVSMIDEQVGRLMSALDALGIAEETIVVFWSDHGYHLGEHDGIWQKRTLFEQGSRTPMIMRDLRRVGRGHCRRVVELLDLYPTICELAHVDAPEELQGRSLVPLMDDPSAMWNGSAVTQILRPADHRLSAPVMGCSIRTAQYRYTQWGPDGASGVECYDHRTDPGEFDNLAMDPDESMLRTMGRLKGALESRATSRTPTSPYNPPRL